jgi:hypothetical protein
VNDLLIGSSTKGYVGSYTLGNLDRIEVVFDCNTIPGCNLIPTAVMDCIALWRGAKPYTLNQFKIKTPGMCLEEKTISQSPLPLILRLRCHIRGSSFIRGTPVYDGNVESG